MERPTRLHKNRKTPQKQETSESTPIRRRPDPRPIYLNPLLQSVLNPTSHFPLSSLRGFIPSQIAHAAVCIVCIVARGLCRTAHVLNSSRSVDGQASFVLSVCVRSERLKWHLSRQMSRLCGWVVRVVPFVWIVPKGSNVF